MAEGMNIAIGDAVKDEDVNGRRDKLLVLLKIMHRALTTNCPNLGESGADSSIWEKSLALRQTLVENVAVNLLTELAGCADEGSSSIAQVEEVMKIWEDQNVCDDSNFWGGLKRKWESGLKKKSDGVAESADVAGSTTKDEQKNTDATSAKNQTIIDDQNDNISVNAVSETVDTVKQTTEVLNDAEGVAAHKSEENGQEKPSSDDRRAKFSRQDSTMSTTSVGEIDYEVRFMLPVVCYNLLVVVEM